MDGIQITQRFDSNRIWSFLDHVVYKKFNLYPGVTDVHVKHHLYEIFEFSMHQNVFFIAEQDGIILSVAMVRRLDWDSQHFGYKCAKIDFVLIKQNLNPIIRNIAVDRLIAAVENYAITSNIAFMSVAIDSWDTATSYALQNHNFKYILTWLDGIYLSKSELPVPHSRGFEIRPVKKSEIELYKNLALNNYFKGGRFYNDLNVDDNAADQMYSKLVDSSYRNNDIVLSCKLGRQSVGLFIYKRVVNYKHFNELKVSILRFFVIDPNVRLKNNGYNFFAATLNFMMKDCDVISTGLEVHNLPSLNLHKKLNFKFNCTNNVFHWWVKNA